MSKHRVLRKHMKTARLEQGDIAYMIHRSTAYVSKCMNGHSSWGLDEVYIIMDALHLGYEFIPVVFPRGGMYAGEVVTPEKTIESQLADKIVELVMGREQAQRRKSV